ncbi:class I SAM-dependent methyltransferase [Algoriphagus sp. H41]|uniref:Class I SAM-dependent methyltransferase n=1 Tax=Algoriphagus oliviformis TaxID=2811231 RepID=A0ABS3C7I8_9BACT|nr:CmcI family methyltransferase [Algoriphagus oliviformis]MBN7812942.1 class I SAM-dependent methyltransferase [Algoriphagus oliviformis]
MKGLLRRFLYPQKTYSLKEIHEGHYKMEYRGVACQKCPFDYVLYQMIIHEVNPDLIIEIGTNKGGSTLYLADLLEINGNGIIHSIDISDNCSPLVKNHPRISLFHQGWEQYDRTLAAGFERVLVIEDSSHTYQNTLDVMSRFKDLVSVDSYLIVEDGIVEDLGWGKSYQGGPVKAIKEFMQTNSNFVVDLRWENFFGKRATFNTSGFLKKSQL